MSEHGEIRIIVVDDDPILLQVLGDLTRRKNYNIRFYSNAAEALDRIRQNPGRYRAVLSDVRMPGMDGLQFAAQVRTLDPSIRVALMSGDSSEETRREIEKLGNVRFLEKPFPIEPTLRDLAL